MPTFTDGMTGTPGDLLSARAGWAVTNGGVDTGRIHTSGEGVTHTIGTGTTLTVFQPTSQPSGNDQYAKALLPSGSGAPLTLGVRYNGGDGYFCRRNTGGTRGILNLFRRTGTTLTSLGTFAATLNVDVTLIELRATGSLIEVYEGGVAVISVTDTTYPSGGVCTASRGGTSGSAMHFDNWESGDVGGGSGITATSAFTFGNMTSAAASVLAIKGLSAPTLQGMTVSAAGLLPVVAAASLALQGMTAASAATLALSGASAITFAGMTSQGDSDLEIAATIAVTFGDMTSSGEGALALTGESSVTFGDMEVSSNTLGFALAESAISFQGQTVNATITRSLDGESIVAFQGMTVEADSQLDRLGSALIQFDDMTVVSINVTQVTLAAPEYTYDATPESYTAWSTPFSRRMT